MSGETESAEPRMEWWAICDNCDTVTIVSPSIDRADPVPDPDEWERFPECMVCDNSAGSMGGNQWSSDVVRDDAPRRMPALPSRDALVASILAARWPGLVGSLALIEGISSATAELIADQILADAGVSS